MEGDTRLGREKMYAIGKNKVTCAEQVCCQPGSEEVFYGEIMLEFCVRHAVPRWLEQRAASNE